MKIIEVKNPQHIAEFLNCVDDIYKNISAYIRPLNKDIERVFNPKKNKHFKHGKIQRWILQNEKGITIGRIAAFVNEKYTSQHPNTGGLGFFECIEDPKAAFLLLNTAKEWLKNENMESIDGPINFGEKDEFWGLTIENFNHPPYYKQNLTPQYYYEYFKKFGFEIFYKQLVYLRNPEDRLQEKYEERASKLAQDPEYTIEFISKKNLDKYTEDFRSIYNRAWGKRDGASFKGMSAAQAKSIMSAIKPILDERLILYAYHNGNPIGFYISLPEVNELFKFFNGKFGWLEKLRFLWMLKTGKIKTCFGTAFGIDPEYQGQGVEGFLFKACHQKLKDTQYKDVIITWLGDFNGKMVRIIEQLGAKKIQEMATLRYHMDRNRPVERYKIDS